MSAATHYKGFDQFASVTFHLGAEPLVAALQGSPFQLRYMPAHEAQQDFPLTLEALEEYDAALKLDPAERASFLAGETIETPLATFHCPAACGEAGSSR